MTTVSPHKSSSQALHYFAVFSAICTLLLICIGGLVTSKEAGMAVPDWPNTYGYNMFFFPISRWVGNVFYEHTHRLVASGVGFLTLVMCIWLWMAESRKWLKKLGTIALFAVILQGVLGGLRVTLIKNEIGIFHATLAQTFFVLMVSLALFTSNFWKQWNPTGVISESSRRLRVYFLILSGVILTQLMIGATMRHQHAGLAIPDFPLAYGKVWPDTSAEAIARYNHARTETTGVDPIRASGVILQMVHRGMAYGIFTAAITLFVFVRKQLRHDRLALRATACLLGFVFVQVALGAATIWTAKSADIATTHVAVGALTLVLSSVTTILLFAREARLSTTAKTGFAARPMEAVRA